MKKFSGIQSKKNKYKQIITLLGGSKYENFIITKGKKNTLRHQ